MRTYKKITLLYLLLIITVLPLFTKDGFYKLGEAKGILFMGLGGVFFAVCVITMLRFKLRLNIGIFGALLFSGVTTFIFSVDKRTAFLGLDGWRMGFLSFLFIIFFACVLSDGIEVKRAYATVLLIPFAISILAILGRFGIYPLGVSASDGSFLSTIGNINWFTAYLSIFVPLGVGIAATKKRFSLEFFICETYVIAGTVALLVQGSESGLLIIAGTYLLLLFMGLSDRELFKAFLIQLFTLGIAMASVYLLIFFFGKRYTYEDNLLIRLCMHHIGIVLMALALFVYRLTRFMEEVSYQWKKNLYRKFFFLLTIIGAVAAAIFIFGIYGDDFGNGRGIIWRMSLDMYAGLDPFRKIVGVGQDCFYSYAYGNPFWSESFINVFDGNRLTNAHNMYLTLLIENGAMGLLSYLFVFGHVLFKLIKAEDKKKHAAVICALPIFAYLINGLVSFSTVVSTPYAFLLLGYSLYITKEESSDITQDQARE